MSTERAPDISGNAGRAWIVSLAEARRTPDHQASIESYLLDIPGAHPFWHRWALSVIHLRDIPGVPPAHISVLGATHELSILSIDPNWQPDLAKPSLGFDAGVPFLTPADVVEQFIVRNDADARQLGAACVRAIVDGHLSPDQDFRPAWRRVIAETAKHIREGRHPTS
jgi:hypothetical protein